MGKSDVASKKQKASGKKAKPTRAPASKKAGQRKPSPKKSSAKKTKSPVKKSKSAASKSKSPAKKRKVEVSDVDSSSGDDASSEDDVSSEDEESSDESSAGAESSENEEESGQGSEDDDTVKERSLHDTQAKQSALVTREKKRQRKAIEREIREEKRAKNQNSFDNLEPWKQADKLLTVCAATNVRLRTNERTNRELAAQIAASGEPVPKVNRRDTTKLCEGLRKVVNEKYARAHEIIAALSPEDSAKLWVVQARNVHAKKPEDLICKSHYDRNMSAHINPVPADSLEFSPDGVPINPNVIMSVNTHSAESDGSAASSSAVSSSPAIESAAASSTTTSSTADAEDE